MVTKVEKHGRDKRGVTDVPLRTIPHLSLFLPRVSEKKLRKTNVCGVTHPPTATNIKMSSSSSSSLDCTLCNKPIHHPKQLEDHLKSPAHLTNVKREQYKELVRGFIRTCRDGNMFMILDLEGNVLHDNQMILLELSFLTFRCVDGTFQITSQFNTLVQPGLISSYPEKYQSLIKYTIRHKHGLRFSVCQEHGVKSSSACEQLSAALPQCQFVFAKGAGMEKLLLQGCRLQDGYDTPPSAVPVIDMLDIEGLDMKTQHLDQYPNCGKHLAAPEEGMTLHCSLGEVHCFYDQLVQFMNSK